MEYLPDRVDPVMDDVLSELLDATATFGPFASAHEGYAVLLEEVDELWDEVKNNKHNDPSKMRKEAIQVAAMAIRFVLDVDSSNMGKEINAH